MTGWTVTSDGLRRGSDWAPREAVLGFRERYGRWSGRAWVEVVGPGWTLPLDAGWAPLRSALRSAYPDRPFVSDWRSGWFPGMVWGGPVDRVTAFAAPLALACAGAAAAQTPALGLAAGALALWALARLRDRVGVFRGGVRVGPVWAPLVDWTEVRAVRAVRQGAQARVTVDAAGGSASACIPAALVPALRARVLRLGGVVVLDGGGDPLDDAYRRVQAAAAVAPWGLLAGATAVAPFTDQPAWTWTNALLASSGAALLGQAVEARATGWGLGGVFWMTLLHGLVLAALAVGLSP
jgi:hypothetical protein